jgi:serine/threonine-protein kinase
MEHADDFPEPYRAGVMIGEGYRLDRMAGEGGMGSVRVATNVRLGTPVAIKLIRRHAQGPGAAERLLQEARAGISAVCEERSRA